jgi:hypothetical protein
MAWVYLGSSSGTESAPDWYKDSDHAGAQFGYSVGTAGDVNGDGYADVIVGAPFYSSPESSEGVASVYHGTPDGLHVVPDWHAEIDQTNALFSSAVGTAGDINGDGYADVIVGAPNWSNGSTSEGGAWVYLGSGSGLSLTHRWHQEGDRYDATYGASVGTAGDVNGDGWSDIIIGAPRWSNGQATEGKAFVYHSTGSSLSLTPAWTKESDTAGTQFGYSVSTAGDVNGDGYADIIVGAVGWHDEGGAFLYQGTATGPHIVPNWHAGGGQSGVRFGYSVAGAGDVNGDGYADVVVGAPWYEDLFAQEGRAFVFYGNASRGVPLRMRQLNESVETIAHLGKAKTDHFRVYILRPSPFGSGDIKIELEAKPLGQRFDGTNTRIPILWNKPTLGSGAYIGSPDVTPGTPYHWRVRLRYNPATTPFMSASRWVTIPWNGWNEADLLTAGSRLFLPLVLRSD